MKAVRMACVAALVALGAAHAQDAYMGDWQGTLKLDGKAEQPLAVYLIPYGGGNYEAKLVPEFNKRVPTLFQLRGRLQRDQWGFLDAINLDPDRVVRTVDDGVVVDTSLWKGTLKDGQLTGAVAGKVKGSFALKQTTRTSPTFELAPPADAVVLFDGKSLDAWEPVGKPGAKAGFKLVDGGCAEVAGGDIITKEKFGSYKLHLEFRTPFMPDARGQGRGNSGVYMQGRYEIQVLDSYGLEGEDNECGGIYQVAKPLANMCLPPRAWQTYDLTFTAPKLDGDGHKTANARLTLVHNGVTIHDNIEIPRVTGGAVDDREGTPGGIKLQDHGNPVQYRNIWLQRLP